jgi:hypothetical protein
VHEQTARFAPRRRVVIFSRPDADRIRDLPRLRRFMPFISPRRNDSLVLYRTEVELDAANAFLTKINETRPPEMPMTIFHLYLRAAALAIQERPGVNRFVSGGRLWQRNHVAITFSAKRSMEEGAPVVSVKRIFPAGESLAEMVDDILEDVHARRRGREVTSDKEVKLALEFPGFLIRAGLWLLDKANHWNLLPRQMIDDDPLFASLFVANLGSVGLGAGFHHLWEYGTCSLFGVVGGFRERSDGVEVMNVDYTYDERVEDGLYAGITLERLKEKLENPESLL